MSKKNKNKSLETFASLGISSPLSDDTEDVDAKIEEQKKVKKSSILEDRYYKRKIPKVDDDVRMVNGRADMSTEALHRFYEKLHISEFVKTEGNRFIKFNFGPMLKGYENNLDENGENEIIRQLSYAEISKKSFINNINLTVRYINYFIEYFDDDDELMNAYYQMMFQINYRKVTMNVEDFIEALFATIATDSLVKKVIRMVEYNTDETLIKKSERSYDESIQLTVDHLKAIMGVSCFHKFVIPIVSHYYSVRQKELEAEGWKYKDLYYIIFSSFIPLFDKYYDISLYEKLYHTATTRIAKTENQENTMWKRRNRFGTTTISFNSELMRDYLNEISQKVIFSQSAIVFIHVCFDKAIRNELIQPDKYEMSDIKMEPSDNVNETISRWDRWQIDRTLHSEKDRLRAYVITKDAIYRLGLKVGIDFKKMEATDQKSINETKELREEYQYYVDHILRSHKEGDVDTRPFDDTQIYLTNLYFASKINCAVDAEHLEPEQRIKLIMIMKRDLSSRNYVYMQFFISGKLNPTKAKKINIKTVEKLFTKHPSYEDWLSEYEDTIELLNKDKMLGALKMMLSVPFTVIDWEYTRYRDSIMYPSDMCIVDEFMRFQLEL